MKKLILCIRACFLIALIPISMQGQNKAQTSLLQKSDDFKLEFHYSNDVLAQQNQASQSISQQQLLVDNFAASYTQWQLSKVDIDQPSLRHNSSNYSQLLSEAKASFGKQLIYVENAKKALFAKNKAQVQAIYFGKTDNSNNQISLNNKVADCPSCSKIVIYQKSTSGNTMQIRMQAEDEDKSDVFYLLTFNK